MSSDDDLFEEPRRTVLKTIGAGTGLSMFSGLAAADDDRGHGNDEDGEDEDNPGGSNGGNGDGQGADGCSQGACIHPFMGFVELPDDIDPVDAPVDPDHTVTLHVHLSAPQEACGNFVFHPAGLHIDPGDVVRFDPETENFQPGPPPSGKVAGDHTITAYNPVVSRQRRMPEEATPFSSPIVGEDASWLYKFEEEGVYDIYCGPHEPLGMVMRIVVGDVENTAFGAPGLPGKLPPLGAANNVLTNPSLDPANIISDGPISWQDAFCVDLTSGLVAYYPLDGFSTGSTVPDRSGNGNDGTAQGGVGPTMNNGGQIDEAFDFDGTDDFVDIPDSSDLDGMSDLTVAAWLNYPQLTGNDMVVVGKLEGYELVVDGKDRVGSDLWWAVDNGDGDWAVNNGGMSLGPDTWHHVALVSDSNADEIRLYHNGMKTLTNSGTGSITDNGNNLGIGERPPGSSTPTLGKFKGKIDEVRIYDRALTDGEVQALANSM